MHASNTCPLIGTCCEKDFPQVCYSFLGESFVEIRVKAVAVLLQSVICLLICLHEWANIDPICKIRRRRRRASEFANVTI